MILSDIVGILNNHRRFCNVVRCSCREISNETDDIQSQIVNRVIITTTKEVKGEQSIYLLAKCKGMEKLMCEILNSTLRNMNLRENNSRREIIQGYVNYYLMNRIFNSLYNIMLAEENNITFFQEFQLFCLRYFTDIIENQLSSAC